MAFNFSSKYSKLPSNMESFFHTEIQPPTSSEHQIRKASFDSTCQLSTFYGLEQTFSASEVESLRELTLHVVGARIAECRDVRKWEIFPQRLPNLKKFWVVFVGPQIR